MKKHRAHGEQAEGSAAAPCHYAVAMTTQALAIPFPELEVRSVSAVLHAPSTPAGRPAVLLAHGAGLPMSAPFMQHVGRGLAQRGLPTLCFNYAYAERMAREGKRRPPDRRPLLESVHLGALEFLRERYPARPLLLAGKSMGGRMGSYLAALGEGSGCVFLGYPLHPAGKPERLRDEHFPLIAQPSLFLQGSRDALCGLEALRRSLEAFGGRAELQVIEQADHDFALPARVRRSREEVLDELVERIDRWVLEAFPCDLDRGGPSAAT